MRMGIKIFLLDTILFITIIFSQEELKTREILGMIEQGGKVYIITDSGTIEYEKWNGYREYHKAIYKEKEEENHFIIINNHNKMNYYVYSNFSWFANNGDVPIQSIIPINNSTDTSMSEFYNNLYLPLLHFNNLKEKRSK